MTQVPPLEGGLMEEEPEMAATAPKMLPGEQAPLPPRVGGAPPTEQEALGTARRMAREQAARQGKQLELPETMPFKETSGTTPLLSVRVGKRTLWFGHAKADMEKRSISDVVREALDAYGQTPPGSRMVFVPPGQEYVIVPEGHEVVLREIKVS